MKDPKKIASYSKTSSTSSYRTHLSKIHIARWVDSCDQLKIPISGDDFQPLVEEYRSQRDNRSKICTENSNIEERLAFSAEAFLDAIMDFVVGDDQVRLNYLYNS